MSDIIDRPPAGTRCSVCYTIGHFCAATQYFGLTDDGICDPCSEGKVCPVGEALRKRQDNNLIDALEPMPDSVPAPVRVIAPEDWPADTSFKEQRYDTTSVPFGMRQYVRAELNKAPAPNEFKPGNWNPKTNVSKDSPAIVADRKLFARTFTRSAEFIESLGVAEIKLLRKATWSATSTSWFIEEKVCDHWHMVMTMPIFYADREIARAIAIEISAASDDKETQIMKWEKGPEFKSTRVVMYRKPENRELAERLLRDQYKPDVVAERSGLSPGAVLAIRRDMRIAGEIIPNHMKPKKVAAQVTAQPPEKEKEEPMPKHILSDEKVKRNQSIKELCMIGITVPNICSRLGISEQTVRNVKREWQAVGMVFPDPYQTIEPIPQPEPPLKEIEIMPKEEPEMTPQEIANAAYVDVCSAVVACHALYEAANVKLPEPLYRFLNEPIRMRELAIRPAQTVAAPVITDTAVHPLFEALFRSLPEPGTEWKSKARHKWMETAIRVIDLVYTDPEDEDWMYYISRDSLKG